MRNRDRNSAAARTQICNFGCVRDIDVFERTFDQKLSLRSRNEDCGRYFK